MNVRNAEEHEFNHLAEVWHEAWHDAQSQLVPPELTQLRTIESFRSRLRTAPANIRVAGPPGAPVGFCIVKDDEVYQLFVAANARGTGVASALLQDAEALLRGAGVSTAWLACAIGNYRAARFYEKSGWHRVGSMINHAETTTGSFPLEVWRFEKVLIGV